MKNALIILVSAVLIVCCCGFIESSRIIRIHKDGSGEILVRVLKNPKFMEKEEKAHDPAVLKKVVYGKGVDYVISTEIKGKNGWVGYLVKYTFKDVTELRIFPASLPRASKDAIVSNEDPIYKSGWKFEISGGGGDGFDAEDEFIDQEAEGPKEGEAPTPAPAEEAPKTDGGGEGEGEEPVVGNTFTLTIVPLYLEFEDDEGDFEEAGDVPEDLNLKLQQTGRRYVTYVQLDGDVDKESSTIPSAHLSELKKNTFVLNDEQFLAMWTTASARARIADVEPDFAAYVGDPGKVNGYRAVVKETKVVLK